jgi:predicted esterase
MKTLYIHGLDSFPKPDKLDIMKNLGLDPVALHLNYREKLGVYETLKDAALHNNVQFIIGSSLGGYLGFLLSADLGIPCLLFNPAMNYKEQVFYSVMPEVTESKCPYRFVVLGANDDTVSPEETIKELKKYEEKGFQHRIVTCEWLGHQIDLTTFESMINWALGSLKAEGCPNV